MAQSSRQPISDAERLLGELLESAPDAILELDHEGRIVLLNRMAEQLFGYAREELLGQTVEALVPEALRNAHKGHRSQYFDQPVTRPMGSGLKLGGTPQGWLALSRRDQPRTDSTSRRSGPDEGCWRWRLEGLGAPLEVTEASAAWQGESDGGARSPLTLMMKPNNTLHRSGPCYS